MHYLGVRSSKVVPELDLGVRYFSSSSNSKFIEDQLNNPTKFKYKIIRTFLSRKLAVGFEVKIHERLNVGVNCNFYNLAKQTSSGFDRTGIRHSEDTKMKMSKCKIGKKWTEEHTQRHKKSLQTQETRSKLSTAARNSWTDERKNNHSTVMKRMFLNNPSVKLKMSTSQVGRFKNQKIRHELSEAVKLSNTPEVKLKKSESAVRRLNSPERILQIGVFVTPLREYVSLPEKIKVSNSHNMSHTTVRKWCKTPNVRITRKVHKLTPSLSESVGKTHKELGFFQKFTDNITVAERWSDEIIQQTTISCLKI